ncbi:MAG: TetR/AcrR family transcriptional regulator [Gammaproteobacteria bacterium]|nr:TetR/AcrR family transcriptional regulator [Gammaproteobacteria bacterium]
MSTAHARNPDQTRQILLQAALEEIHQCGFQAASLSNILAKTGLTKGALYHHFPDKLALGYAVVEELIEPDVHAKWVQPLLDFDNPIDGLLYVIEEEGKKLDPCGCNANELFLGCPLNNLAQEMSPVDEGFRTRIQRIYAMWRAEIGAALVRGQQSGKVRADINPDAAATFTVAALEGCIGMAKNARDIKLLYTCGAGLIQYLESLRVKPNNSLQPHPR